MSDLRVSVVDNSGNELYSIPLRTDEMSKEDISMILMSEDPRQTYEKCLLREMNQEKDLSSAMKGNIRKDLKKHFGELDHKIAQIGRDKRVRWKRAENGS